MEWKMKWNLEHGIELAMEHGNCNMQWKMEWDIEWNLHSDFIWPFLRLYMGVIPNPEIALICTISGILALIFPILLKYFPICEGKGK